MIPDRVKIIKEFVLNERYETIHFTVRTKWYNDSVQYWLDLIDILKKDFPDADLNKVKSVVYGGDCYKKTRGIELTLDKPVKIPDGYVDGVRLTDTL